MKIQIDEEGLLVILCVILSIAIGVIIGGLAEKAQHECEIVKEVQCDSQQQEN